MRFLHLLAFSFLLTDSMVCARGSIVTYHATGVFTSSDFPSDIAVGDQFTIDFAYDDSVSDSNSGQAGNYTDALVSLDFRLIPGFSTGQYSGGSLTGRGEVETIDGVSANFPDRFYARVDGGTFPQLGGFPFGGLLFVLDDPSYSSSIIDSGGSPALAFVLNGELLLSQFSDTTVRISPEGKNGRAEGVVSSLTIVPEPTSILLLGFSALLLIGYRVLLRPSRR